MREALGPNTNVYLRRECTHVAAGALAVDVVKVSTVGHPPPLVYRYQKGPDEMSVCAECALELFDLLMQQCGRDPKNGLCKSYAEHRRRGCTNPRCGVRLVGEV